MMTLSTAGYQQFLQPWTTPTCYDSDAPQQGPLPKIANKKLYGGEGVARGAVRQR